MTHVLSFKLQPIEEKTEDGTPFIVLHITPLVDDKSFFATEAAEVFDVLRVLVRRDTPSRFYPFVCACGDPGCAGIHDPAELLVEGETVSWIFPEEFFRKALATELFPAGAPLTATFAKLQYLAALDALTSGILALEKSREIPVILQPESHPQEHLDKPVAAVIDEAHLRYALYQIAELGRLSLFRGTAYGQVHLTFANGHTYSAQVQSLLWTLAQEAHPGNRPEQREFIQLKLVPDVQSNLTSLLARLAATPISALAGSLWSETEVELDQESWQGAVLTADLS